MQSMIRSILAKLMRPRIKKFKRANPRKRLERRMWYRRNKNKINRQRRLRSRKNHIFHRSNKLHRRKAPSWLHHALKKFHSPKPKIFKHSKPHPLSHIVRHITVPKSFKPRRPHSLVKHKLYVPKKH